MTPASGPPRYRFSRVAAGMYLQLSDDRRTLFRAVKYREDGSAERTNAAGKVKPVVGWYWRLDMLAADRTRSGEEVVRRDAAGRITAWDPDLLAADTGEVDWDAWWWLAIGTRREALQHAADYVPIERRPAPKPSVVDDTLGIGHLLARRPKRPEEG